MISFFLIFLGMSTDSVPSASDVILSKNDNSGGKTREASEGVEYDFYFTEYDLCSVWSRVLIFTHCPIKLIYLW
jgi:hypothetical protein